MLIYLVIISFQLIITIIFNLVSYYMSYNLEIESIIMLIFIRINLLTFSHFANKIKNRNKYSFTIPKIYYFANIVILFCTFYLFMAIFDKNGILIRHIEFSELALIIVNITIIMIDGRIYKSVVLEHENKVLQLENNAYENQIIIINQAKNNFEILKHDMENHLQMVNSLIEDEKKEEVASYIKNLYNELNMLGMSTSGNFVLDSIINLKLSKQRDVDINLDIKVPENINIQIHDLTVLLGNLLDNAITALSKVEIKKLNLKIKYDSMIGGI
ncbi:MAG: GHKL domain-containing protein [Lachnospirales bacterium]